MEVLSHFTLIFVHILVNSTCLMFTFLTLNPIFVPFPPIIKGGS